jgi:hypothetical protein
VIGVIDEADEVRAKQVSSKVPLPEAGREEMHVEGRRSINPLQYSHVNGQR